MLPGRISGNLCRSLGIYHTFRLSRIRIRTRTVKILFVIQIFYRGAVNNFDPQARKIQKKKNNFEFTIVNMYGNVMIVE